MNSDTISVPRTELRVIGAAIVVAALATIAAVIALANLTGTYDPLGEFPVQRVESKVPGRSEPATLLSSESVVVTGTKCADKTTAVRGEFSWVEIEPAGFTVLASEGNNIRMKGCTTNRFVNDMPDRVQERVRSQCERGDCETTWQLVGIETPISPAGKDGEPRPWQSQNFTIIADMNGR